MRGGTGGVFCEGCLGMRTGLWRTNSCKVPHLYVLIGVGLPYARKLKIKRQSCQNIATVISCFSYIGNISK